MSQALQKIEFEPLRIKIQAMEEVFVKSEGAEAKLKERHEGLVDFLTTWDGEPNDELEVKVEEAKTSIIAAKKAYDKWNPIRMEITGALDELKSYLMVPEKRVDSNGKDNYPAKIRAEIAKIEQLKINKRAAAEKLVADRKKKEDHKVELERLIKIKLNDLVMGNAVKMEEYSQKFFGEATIETIAEKSKQYKAIKPLLKEDRYNTCFPQTDQVLTTEEFGQFIAEVKGRESLKKYHDLVVQGITPVMNDWIGRIPSIQEQIQKIANADGEEKKRLEDEQKSSEQTRQQQSELNFSQAKAKTEAQVNADAEIGLMHNAFQQQGVVQSMDPTGPKKKVLRFVTPKMIPKRLAEIQYHCFLSEKFFGIYKLDKDKKRVVENGLEVYIEPIQWWIDFFMMHCEGNVEDTEIKEVAKVIIRK